jgi:hypothetical protein
MVRCFASLCRWVTFLLVDRDVLTDGANGRRLRLFSDVARVRRQIRSVGVVERFVWLGASS